MSEPIVTTVIPTYRRPAMLRRAIRSVLNQTFRDFRVCVYDNASGDETATVVEEFSKSDSRVEYVCRPTNIGMTPNFVDGAKRVKTPFFSFLADDDLMIPHFLEVALSGFERYPEAALSILPTLCMSPRGFIVLVTNLRWPEGLILPPEGVLHTLRLGNPGLQAMLIRKSTWDEFGGFDKATDPAGEYDFDLRVMARRPVVISKTPGGIQIMHRDTSTAAGGLNWVWPAYPRIINKLTQNTDLQPILRRSAVEAMTERMKRALITQGIMKSISRGIWVDAEMAAEILAKECEQSRVARVILGAAVGCARLPGSRFFLKALFALRSSEKAMRNLSLQWHFRAYSRFLRASTKAAASGVNLASNGCAVVLEKRVEPIA